MSKAVMQRVLLSSSSRDVNANIPHGEVVCHGLTDRLFGILRDIPVVMPAFCPMAPPSSTLFSFFPLRASELA
eukprot:UN4967